MTDEHEARFDNADEQDEELETDTIKLGNGYKIRFD